MIDVTQITTVGIEQGDAVEKLRELPNGSVDLIVTDPGYQSIEKQRYGGPKNIRRMSTKDGWWGQSFPDSRYGSLFFEMYRVLRDDSHLYVFVDEETKGIILSGYNPVDGTVVDTLWKRVGFKFCNSLIWVKTKQGSWKRTADDLAKFDINFRMGYHYRKSKEYILFFSKGKRNLKDKGIADVLPFPPPYNGFPTQKPEALIRLLIAQSSEEGDLVVDPFAGSGTTACAARSIGRRCLLFDLDVSDISIPDSV